MMQSATGSISNLDKTVRDRSLAPIDDLIRFGRLKVKVTAGRRGQILRRPYLMISLSNLDETYRERLLMTWLDFECQRSKVKFTAGLSTVCDGKGIQVDAGTSKSII